MKLDFKHNLNEFAKDVLNNFLNTISQNKKQLHQQAADIVREDIREHYDEEFAKVVDPNSTWQRLKESLGFPSKPGHFTDSTFESIIAEASDRLGEVMLKGTWPSKDKLGGKAEVTPSGVKIKAFRDDMRGIRTGNLSIPSEDFSTKQFGSWRIDRDIVFMKLRPDAEKKVVDDMRATLENEMRKILSNFQKGSK